MDERRPEQFAAFVRDEVARWDKIIREARIRIPTGYNSHSASVRGEWTATPASLRP